MAKVSMTQEVRVASTGEVTTLAKLAEQGRLRFSTGLMDTKKRNGERKSVRKYFADLVEADRTDGSVSGWEIGELAYKSRTGQAIEVTR